MGKLEINNSEIYIIDLISKIQAIKENVLLNVINQDNEIGSIFFQNGIITHAKTSTNYNGNIAIEQILNWDDYSEKKLSLEKKENNRKYQIFFLEQSKDSFKEFDLDIDEKYQNICNLISEKYKDILGLVVIDIEDKKCLSKQIKANSESNDIYNFYFDYIINMIQHQLIFNTEKLNPKDFIKELDIDKISSSIGNEGYSRSNFLCMYKFIDKNKYVGIIAEPSTTLVFGIKYIKELYSEIIK